jgi:hypothetical protein
MGNTQGSELGNPHPKVKGPLLKVKPREMRTVSLLLHLMAFVPKNTDELSREALRFD